MSQQGFKVVLPCLITAISQSVKENKSAVVWLLVKTTIARKVRDLQRRIEEITSRKTDCNETQKILRKFRNAIHQFLTFAQRPGEIDPTNNRSERALRPAVITRKATNGFRSKWAADADCRVRTVVDTAKLSGSTPFHTITRVLTD